MARVGTLAIIAEIAGALIITGLFWAVGQGFEPHWGLAAKSKIAHGKKGRIYI